MAEDGEVTGMVLRPALDGERGPAGQ
jgi:hypothetical protein